MFVELLYAIVIAVEFKLALLKNTYITISDDPLPFLGLNIPTQDSVTLTVELTSNLFFLTAYDNLNSALPSRPRRIAVYRSAL
jgi:hypothetical protein